MPTTRSEKEGMKPGASIQKTPLRLHDDDLLGRAVPTLTTTSGSGSKRPRDGSKDGGTELDAKYPAIPDNQGKPGGKGGNAAGTGMGANSSDMPKGGGLLRDEGNMPGSSPLNTAEDGTGAANRTNADPDKVEGPFIQVLYDKIKNYFPPGNGQYFALQFPTRFLDKDTYAHNTADSFARFEKPVSVNEAEFRLTDELFPVGPIVGGPNGQSLVSNYVKALNSLTPYDGSMARKQREKMRTWLLTQTSPGDAAGTVDTSLGVPGVPADAASALSSSSGIAGRPSWDFSFNGDGTSAAGTGGIKLSASVNSNQMTAIKANAMRALEGVESTDSLKPRPMTRMEFRDSLMMDYLEESERWETEKDALIAEAEAASRTDPKAINQLVRNLVHIQGQKYAKFSARYADAVVRGHLHTIHESLGHLDIKAPAELLQDAKDSLRNSAMSSLYTASSIYPVQMMPADWFMGLDTGFTREDLSQDPEMVKAAIQAKSMTIDSLQNQIATLRGFFKGNPQQFKDALNEVAEERDKALGDLTSKYAESTISEVKLLLTEMASATPVGQVPAAASETASLASAGLNSIKNGIDEGQKSRLKGLLGENFEKLDDVGKLMDAVDKANVKVNAKSRELTERMGDFALAMAGDTRTEVENLQRKLTVAKAELEDLHQSYLIAMQAKSKRTGATPPSLEKDGQLPSNTPGGGGTRWFDISLNTEVAESASASSSSQSSSSSAWNCSFWIGSYSSSTSKNDAQTASTESASSLKIDISMRVTYVTVDRSGWFDPSFMEVSGSFMHSSPDGVYTPWSKWPTSTASTSSEDGAIPTPLSAQEVVEKIVQNRMVPNAPELVPGYLVAYPIGYILVKDCVLKLSNHRNSNTFDKKHFDEQSQSSGGILCFSHSSGSGSSKDTSSSSSLQTSDGLVIRIPGPQILGYMMQLMPQDASKKFEAMPPDYLFDGDVDPSSRKATSGGESPIAEHSINIPSDPAAGSARPKPASGVREYKVAESSLANGVAVGKPEPIVTAAHSVNMTQPVPQAVVAKEGGADSNANAKAAQSFVDAIRDALTSNDAFFKQTPAPTKAEILRKIDDLKLVFDS